MRIYFEEENAALDKSLLETMEKASSRAAELEGLPDDICQLSVTFVTPEEIHELNKWSEEEVLKQQLIDSMSKPGYFYEMTAEREDGAVSVNVCIENVAIMEQPDVTEDMYVASAVLNAQEHFKEAGCLNVVIEKDAELFAGAEHYFYHVSCVTPDGRDLYYKAVYVKEGIYAAVITASSAGEDLTGEVLSMFYQV